MTSLITLPNLQEISLYFESEVLSLSIGVCLHIILCYSKFIFGVFISYKTSTKILYSHILIDVWTSFIFLLISTFLLNLNLNVFGTPVYVLLHLINFNSVLKVVVQIGDNAKKHYNYTSYIFTITNIMYETIHTKILSKVNI